MLSRSSSYRHLLRGKSLRGDIYCHQKRTIFPIIAGGAAIVVGLTLAQYAMRAYDRTKAEMEEERLNGGTTSSNTEAVDPLTRSLGLDVGSSYSKISYYDFTTDTHPNILENREGRRNIASSIAYDTIQDSLSVGQLPRAGRFNKTDTTIYAPSFIYAAQYCQTHKAPLLQNLPFTYDEEDGDGMINVVLNKEHKFDAGYLMQHLVEEVYRSAIDKMSTKASMYPTILTTPSFFNNTAREQLVEDLQIDGMNIVGVMPDSVASFLGAYALKEKGIPTKSDLSTYGPSGTTIAIVDVGGRVTQLSLLHVALAGEHVDIEVLSESHSLDVGGEYIDELLVQHLSTQFKETHKIELLSDSSAKQRLFDAAETAKKDLTSGKMADINIPFISAGTDGPLHLTSTLSRAQLENMIERQISSLSSQFKALIFDPDNGAKAPLTCALMVGGASRLPVFKTCIEGALGMRPVVVPEPESVGAVGAAAAATRLGSLSYREK